MDLGAAVVKAWPVSVSPLAQPAVALTAAIDSACSDLALPPVCGRLSCWFRAVGFVFT